MSALQLLQRTSAVVCGSIITACAWMVQWQSGQVKFFEGGVNGIFLRTIARVNFLRGEFFLIEGGDVGGIMFH